MWNRLWALQAQAGCLHGVLGVVDRAQHPCRLGERIARVPPKLMAHARDSARTYGKSDPIDALAVAGAALREPGLPVARLDGREREIRLLVDHREALVAERARAVNRLRWHLHELDPNLDPKPRSLDRAKTWRLLDERVVGEAGTVARLARQLIEQCRRLTAEINELTGEIERLAVKAAPSLLALPGCAALTAAKIIGETAGIDRFQSRATIRRRAWTPDWRLPSALPVIPCISHLGTAARAQLRPAA